MDEEISIIDANTRNEKIKNFFVKNKKNLILIIIIVIFIIFSFFSYQIYQDQNKEQLANKYNSTVIQFEKKDVSKTIPSMKEIIKAKDKTYSPLALYFLIDNNLIDNKNDINSLFDVLINETNLDEEIKYLVIYKKALFNSEFEEENNLIKIINPIINSESVWKSHALYLMADYFYSKKEKQKAKDFFDQILKLDKANVSIKNEAQKRINRDFGE
jgi:predicted negative regulator of RcsB-dependent stress response